MKNYGNNLMAFLVRNADRLGVLYVIWFRQIWFPATGWKSYQRRQRAHGPRARVDALDRFVARNGPRSVRSGAAFGPYSSAGRSPGAPGRDRPAGSAAGRSAAPAGSAR